MRGLTGLIATPIAFRVPAHGTAAVQIWSPCVHVRLTVFADEMSNGMSVKRMSVAMDVKVDG